MGSVLANCSSADYVCDISKVEGAVFDKAVNGDLDTLLRFFETAEKTDDIAVGVPVSLAVIKAFERAAGAFLPDTIVSENHTASDLTDFFRKIVNRFKNLFKRG